MAFHEHLPTKRPTASTKAKIREGMARAQEAAPRPPPAAPKVVADNRPAWMNNSVIDPAWMKANGIKVDNYGGVNGIYPNAPDLPLSELDGLVKGHLDRTFDVTLFHNKPASPGGMITPGRKPDLFRYQARFNCSDEQQRFRDAVKQLISDVCGMVEEATGPLRPDQQEREAAGAKSDPDAHQRIANRMTLRQEIGLETDCGWVPDAEKVEAYLEKKLVSFCDDMHRAAKDCYENAASELDTSAMVESVWHNYIATESEESVGISAEAILDLALTVNDEAAIEHGMRRRFGMVLFKETAGG